MPHVTRKGYEDGTGTPYWIIHGVASGHGFLPIRGKITVTDLDSERYFTVEIMEDSYHPSTPYHSAGQQIYHGQDPEEVRASIDDHFSTPLELGDTTATREHLSLKLNPKKQP